MVFPKKFESWIPSSNFIWKGCPFSDKKAIKTLTFQYELVIFVESMDSDMKANVDSIKGVGNKGIS